MLLSIYEKIENCKVVEHIFTDHCASPPPECRATSPQSRRSDPHSGDTSARTPGTTRPRSLTQKMRQTTNWRTTAYATSSGWSWSAIVWRRTKEFGLCNAWNWFLFSEKMNGFLFALLALVFSCKLRRPWNVRINVNRKSRVHPSSQKQLSNGGYEMREKRNNHPF